MENIEFTLATLDFMKRKVEPTSPQGVYNSTLARTDNEPLANRAMAEAVSAIEMAKVLRKTQNAH